MQSAQPLRRELDKGPSGGVYGQAAPPTAAPSVRCTYLLYYFFLARHSWQPVDLFFSPRRFLGSVFVNCLSPSLSSYIICPSVAPSHCSQPQRVIRGRVMSDVKWFGLAQASSLGNICDTPRVRLVVGRVVTLLLCCCKAGRRKQGFEEKSVKPYRGLVLRSLSLVPIHSTGLLSERGQLNR